MKIYNTLTKQTEIFKPINEKEVLLYTCGPTVYHYAHIGNLRTYIFEDILEKSLNYLGYPVKRVMNITDVGHLTGDSDDGEDKLLKGAIRESKTVYEIADYYTKAFFKDTEKLNIKKPEIISKASDNIETYIKIIESLIEKDYAYLKNGNVYFDVDKVENYYDLSGKNKEDLMIGVRDDVSLDKSKKNPYDFGLWFTDSKFNDQAMKWDSPWGVGYPGWHIECTGISIKYLGEQMDIHCGGVDNIFPHHSNEIAQSEAYLGHKWCNYWMHSEHLNDKSGKMSKSKGDFLTLSLLEENNVDPLAYRFYCLQSHYRNQLVFTFDNLFGASNAYKKLLNKIEKIVSTSKEGEVDKIAFEKYNSLFKAAIENDLNTAKALTTLYDVIKAEINEETKVELIKSFDTVLSLNLLSKKPAKNIDENLAKYIEENIAKRDDAKREKDYKLADAIRAELLEKGIVLKDTKEGTFYEVK